MMDSVYVIFRQAGGEAKVKEFLLPLSGTSEDYQTICSAIWYGLPAPATVVAIINESRQVVVTRDQWQKWIPF
ncbi:hypothetical protein [Acetobacter pasteurianus]|nr:hypothetical protein [Acetobacter pasteurianus]